MADFYLSAAAKQMEALEIVKSEQLAQLRAHRLANDIDSAAEAVQAIADTEKAQENLRGLCNQYVESTQSHQPHVSEESRRARSPAEMDSQDLANLMNESRYSKLGTGRGFSASDYDHLRRSLHGYKTARGIESK